MGRKSGFRGFLVSLLCTVVMSCSVSAQNEPRQDLSFEENIRRIVGRDASLEDRIRELVLRFDSGHRLILKELVKKEGAENIKRACVNLLEKHYDSYIKEAVQFYDVKREQPSTAFKVLKMAIGYLVTLKAKEAVPIIRKFLCDPSVQIFGPAGSVRASALGALVVLGDHEATALAIQSLSSKDFEMKTSAIGSLGKTGNREIVPKLLEMLETEKPPIPDQIIRVLGEMGDERALEPLKERLAKAKAEWEAMSKGEKGPPYTYAGQKRDLERAVQKIELLNIKDGFTRIGELVKIVGTQNSDSNEWEIRDWALARIAEDKLPAAAVCLRKMLDETEMAKNDKGLSRDLYLHVLKIINDLGGYISNDERRLLVDEGLVEK